MQSFTNRLRQLVEQAKAEGKIKSQADVGMALELSPQVMSTYMNGREPNYEVACGLADYFGVTLDYLFGRTEARKQEDNITYEQLGLSSKAIDYLKELKREQDEYNVITAENGELGIRNELLITINFLLESNVDNEMDVLNTLSSYLWLLPNERRDFLSFMQDNEGIDFQLTVNSHSGQKASRSEISLDEIYETTVLEKMKQKTISLRKVFRTRYLLSEVKSRLAKINTMDIEARNQGTKRRLEAYIKYMK